MDEKLQQLVCAAMQGDKEALAALCEYKAASVARICIYLMGNRQDGEDAAQEVLLRMQTGLHRLKSAERFGPWLSGIITNTCRSLKRAGAKPLDHLRHAEEMREAQEKNRAFLPHLQAELQEEETLLLAAMEALPPQYKEALLLYYFEELPIAEIAAQVGVEYKTIQNRLHRARKALRRQLAKAGYEENVHTGAPAAQPAFVLLASVMEGGKREAAPRGAVQRKEFYAPRLAACLQVVSVLLAVGSVGLAANISLSTPAFSGGGAVSPQPVPQQASYDSVAQEDAGVLTIESNAPVDGDTLPTQSALPDGNAADSIPPQHTAPEDTAPPGEDTRWQEDGAEEGETPPSGTPPETPDPQPDFPRLLQGSVVFVDRFGEAVPEAATYTQGATVALWQGEQLLEDTMVGADGGYSLTLPGAGTYTLRVSPVGAGLTGAGALVFTAGQATAALPTVHITDSTAPTCMLRLLDAGGAEQLGSVINPAAAEALVSDNTTTRAKWQILDENGSEIAVGEGATAPLAAATGTPRGSRYTIRYTIEDAARNETVIERDFLMFT